MLSGTSLKDFPAVLFSDGLKKKCKYSIIMKTNIRFWTLPDGMNFTPSNQWQNCLNLSYRKGLDQPLSNLFFQQLNFSYPGGIGISG